MKLDVIVNQNAGAQAGQNELKSLSDKFAENGVNAEIFVANSGAEVVEIARQSVAGDASAVVAAGGDGTINSVASQTIDSGKALGVLPLGTLNHFAKDVGIPLDINEAIRTIALGHTELVDIGEVNGHIFVNNSSLGLYPSIVREREKQQRLGSGKWPAFVWAAFTVLRRYPFLDIRLQAEQKDLISRTPFVFVGNNKYEMETLNIGSRAVMDAGELSLYMTHRTGRFGLVRLAFRALLGKLHQEKDFVALQTQEVLIATKQRRVRVALDGEVTVMQPPLHFRIRPRALSVIVARSEKTG